MMNENWTEIAVTVDAKHIDTAGDIVGMVVPYGIYIEDYSALEEDAMEIAHTDMIDVGKNIFCVICYDFVKV